jgi:uncharacterized membrane protein YecN with MAPEG domain
MVTTLYAGIFGLLYIAFSAYVIKGRFQYQVGLGDGGNDNMAKRIRAHANFIEYVPLALILILLAEFEGTSEIVIHMLGVTLIAGRLSHAMKLLDLVSLPKGREAGMVITFAVIIAASILCIRSFFAF